MHDLVTFDTFRLPKSLAPKSAGHRARGARRETWECDFGRPLTPLSEGKVGEADRHARLRAWTREAIRSDVRLVERSRGSGAAAAGIALNEQQ